MFLRTRILTLIRSPSFTKARIFAAAFAEFAKRLKAD
jgi:hypothetical protein